MPAHRAPTSGHHPVSDAAYVYADLVSRCQVTDGGTQPGWLMYTYLLVTQQATSPPLGGL